MMNLIETTKQNYANYLKQDDVLVNFVKQLDNTINQYEKIAIFYHIRPDGDAFGSAFALKKLIELNYTNKQVVVVLFNDYDDINLLPNETLAKYQNVLKLNLKANKRKKNNFPNTIAKILDARINELLTLQMVFLPEFYNFYSEYKWIKDKYTSYQAFFKDSEVLGICVDVSTYNRINGTIYFDLCKQKYVIDHHEPSKDIFYDAIYQNQSVNSASECVANIMLVNHWKFDDYIAKNLYIALLTDSNRFFYDKLNYTTFNLASILIASMQKEDVYQTHLAIWQQDEKLIDLQTWIWQNKHEIIFKDTKKALYCILTDDLHQKFGLHSLNGQVNTFANIQNVEVWFVVIYDPLIKKYRVSMRSKHKPIVDVARMFNGGGHNLACSCIINDLEVLPTFIEKLKRYYEK